MPVVEIIRESIILKEFPSKTEGDLYLWIIDRQHYLAENSGKPLHPPDETSRDFIEGVEP